MIVILRLFLVLVLFASCQSCNASKVQSVPGEALSSPEAVKIEVNNSLLTKPQEVPMEPRQYKQGEDVKKQLSKISVYDLKKKKNSLTSYLDSKKDTAIVYVKKGCVFCEAFLATMAKEKFSTNVLIVTDEKHSTFEEFVQKQKDNKDIDATWLYDFDNKVGVDLDFRSFPTILIVDGDATVVAHQVGLKMVDDQSKLKAMSFPEALKILATNTVSWLKHYN